MTHSGHIEPASLKRQRLHACEGAANALENAKSKTGEPQVWSIEPFSAVHTPTHVLDEMGTTRRPMGARLHGGIYNAAFQEKKISVHVRGQSVGEIRGNPTAVPVIPHTLIDNALKYSQRESEVWIDFRETANEIELSVESYGPRIEADEAERIFDVFYRGRNAREQEEEGAGFGLYLAQFIAASMGTRITIRQSSMKHKFGYLTTFSVKFRRER